MIKIANFARLDDLNQESAFRSNLKGEANFIAVKTPEKERQKFVDRVVNIYKDSWNINHKNRLGVFLTLNRYLSNINGFENIYNFFYNSSFYKNNWEQINQEFLSKEINKLGESPKKLYDILFFRNLIVEKTGQVDELIPKRVLQNMNYFELKRIYSQLTSIGNTYTLADFIEKSTSFLQNSGTQRETEIWSNILSKFYNIENGNEFSYVNIVENIISPLIAGETSDTGSDELKDAFNNLLEDTIEPFINWFEFINSDSDRTISHSTIHGTKGTEFDNVIVVLEKDFGNKNKNYFEDALSNVIKKVELDPKKDKKQILATNLLYVASTRARKNITFLYFGDIPSDDQEVLEGYFDNYFESMEDFYEFYD